MQQRVGSPPAVKTDINQCSRRVDFPPTAITAPQAGGQVWRKPYFPSPTRAPLGTGMPVIFFYEGGNQLLTP